MKKFCIFSLFLLFGLIQTTRAISLSPEARISVLTCSPGSELYSLFGHSAIRVEDPLEKIDIVFNYGTFNFNTPHFYLKYAQGLLPYQLSLTSYNNFVTYYILDNRSVYSQTLLLPSEEKQRLFDLLLENYEPQYRTYRYNFLFDNCSTRIRDILEKGTQGAIDWHLPDEHKSFWNLLDEYLYRMPWVKWGIHTILGQPGAREATPYQYMFLPDYLLKGLTSATLHGQILATPAETIYQATVSPSPTPWYFSPLFIFSIATLLLIFLLQKIRSRKLLNTVAILLFLISGLIGCLLIFLGFFTEHPITAPNVNLIWANPLNLLAAAGIGKKHLPHILRGYLTVYLVLLLLGIPLWFWAVPAVSHASIPLILLLLYLVLKLKRIKS